jgi:hypothetical protein
MDPKQAAVDPIPKQSARGLLTHYSGDTFFQASGMPLQVIHVSGHPDHLFHDHDFTELVVVTCGRGTHATQTEEYAIRAGDVFVIHPREKHSYLDTEGLAIYNVFFDMDLLRLPLLDIEPSAGYRALFTLEPRLRASHGVKSWLTLSPGQLAIVCDLLGDIDRNWDVNCPAAAAWLAGCSCKWWDTCRDAMRILKIRTPTHCFGSARSSSIWNPRLTSRFGWTIWPAGRACRAVLSSARSGAY